MRARIDATSPYALAEIAGLAAVNLARSVATHLAIRFGYLGCRSFAPPPGPQAAAGEPAAGP